MSKQHLVLTYIALLALLAAPVAAKKGAGGGGGKIPVQVTLRDLAGDGLRSDGAGPYIDGERNVNATVTSSFSLKLFKGARPKTAERELWFDLALERCVSVPSTDCLVDSEFSIGPVSLSTGLDLRQLLPGEQRDSTLIIQLDLFPEDEKWWIFFAPDAVGCADSSPVKVTRDPAGGDVWEIEAGAYSRACLIRQVGSPVNIFSGLYHVPFVMTLERKP